MSEHNGPSENNNRRPLDQMQNLIQSMITSTQEQGKIHDFQHEQMMAEIREQRTEIQGLITLQKEHRGDIMTLFQSQKKSG